MADASIMVTIDETLLVSCDERDCDWSFEFSDGLATLNEIDDEYSAHYVEVHRA